GGAAARHRRAAAARRRAARSRAADRGRRRLAACARARTRLLTPVLARARGLGRGGRVPRQRRDLVGAVARPARCRHGRGQPRARAWRATHPADVGSSDRHTVKPWFNGRIPEAPRVVDLASEGFPLVGGRIDVIGRTPVATLVYRVRQHLISLSEVPAGRTIATSRGQIGGYNIVSWTDNGVAYLAVSDVGAADLDAFAKAFRAAEPER